jgi:hypothetical protein
LSVPSIASCSSHEAAVLFRGYCRALKGRKAKVAFSTARVGRLLQWASRGALDQHTTRPNVLGWHLPMWSSFVGKPRADRAVRTAHGPTSAVLP